MEQIKRFVGFNADFVGSLAAMICAVHCMVFPLLLSVGLVSSAAHNHVFDFVFMGSGVLIAAYVLIKDYINSHKNLVPLALSVVGFILLFIGVESHGELFLLSVTGGFLISLAHFHNWKLSHSH